MEADEEPKQGEGQAEGKVEHEEHEVDAMRKPAKTLSVVGKSFPGRTVRIFQKRRSTF